MKRLVAVFALFTGCATITVAPAPTESAGIPVEVVGHVTRACAAARPQANEKVTIRAAGELDALETTHTDASGAFNFKVVAPGKRPSLLLEAGGKKAIATQPFTDATNLVAEIRLPCEG